jgi:N4-gp56 family major capsid protein
MLAIGENSYGIVPMQGKNAIKIYVVNPEASAADPVAQKGSVGWKMYDGCVILNDLWLARIEVGATGNPT